MISSLEGSRIQMYILLIWQSLGPLISSLEGSRIQMYKLFIWQSLGPLINRSKEFVPEVHFTVLNYPDTHRLLWPGSKEARPLPILVDITWGWFYWHAECNNCGVKRFHLDFEGGLDSQARSPWECSEYSYGTESKSIVKIPGTWNMYTGKLLP